MNIERDYFWFQLFKTRGIGPKSLISIAKILKKEDLSPEMLTWSQSDLSTQFPELSKILNGKVRAEDSDMTYMEYEQLKKQDVEFVHPWHPDFSPQLLEIAPMLFIQGQRKLLNSDGVAIVGSRDVSDTGIRVARELAAEIANAELNVVSGYAKGVDSEAHLGALAEKGTTTMVLPYGIKKLRQKSAFREFDWQEDVLAVSQFDPGVKWLAHNAMARNKVVCALSKAVIVIESPPERDSQGKMSGTFNTARTALDMKRPLFVLDPECFDNPPTGNKDLINLGGECFNPANGVNQIISAVKTELSLVKKQDSPKQLGIRF